MGAHRRPTQRFAVPAIPLAWHIVSAKKQKVYQLGLKKAQPAVAPVEFRQIIRFFLPENNFPSSKKAAGTFLPSRRDAA